MIVTTTERAEFKRCRRRWYFGSPNCMKLTRITPSPALALGTLIHNTLAEWLVNPEINTGEQFMKFAVESVDKAREIYKNQVGCLPSNEELAGLLDSVELGKAMVENYQAFWGSPLPKGFDIIAPEQKVEIPIPGTVHFLESKLDGVVSSPKGNLFVLEHKTYGNRPKLETLQSNDQFLAYVWALTKLDLGNVSGLAYDGMWKRAVPPRGSKIEDLFTRSFIIRPQNELDEFALFLAAEVTEMDNVKNWAEQDVTIGEAETPLDSSILYINRRWEGCFDCSYEPLCTAKSKGEDMEHIMKSMFTVKPDEPTGDNE